MTAGKITRSTMAQPPHTLPYTEMTVPDSLLDLYEGVRLTRFERYPGHFYDEIRLFEVIMRLYRNPSTLLRLSKTKQM